ncbi:MAG: bifunctional phosphopantothenoylcysteine decarboxylase/phosphopantothenate--cysteine ligase CoaBC [Gemmatimonadota bacterium]|nr:bifunctional phosphopantothenoylcysteine decarboxylase/phosphopantothenate--cysteine ligase CoaBC [Gemmatimonadota bacterium]
MTEARARPFAGRRVLLGVAGGIASYKSAWLARLLTKSGAEVDVVMTRAATEFIGAVTFEALTGRPVHTGLFDQDRALDHIKLSRAADAIVIAPTTADFMARAATGQAGDLLTACLLAAECPVMMVPAMNDRMWAHAQTRANAAHLRTLGYLLLEPDVGTLAAGEGSGPGRMPEPEAIFAHVGRLLSGGSLRGRSVLVTAGPTREAIDAVRFISNYSSGKMGVAVAAAAWRRGAEVTLVHGPLAVLLPTGVTDVPVQSTTEMRDAVAGCIGSVDVVVMSAAPADYQPVDRAAGKLKKTGGPRSVELRETPDILVSTIESRKTGSVVVGFALETDDLLANARRKLDGKQLDMVVLNNANEPGAGFGLDTNRVTLVKRGIAEPEQLPLLDKTEVAEEILDRVEAMLHGR